MILFLIFKVLCESKSDLKALEFKLKNAFTIYDPLKKNLIERLHFHSKLFSIVT